MALKFCKESEKSRYKIFCKNTLFQCHEPSFKVFRENRKKTKHSNGIIKSLSKPFIIVPVAHIISEWIFKCRG